MVLLDHIAANIDVTFGYGRIYVHWRNVILKCLLRIYCDLKGLGLPSKGTYIGHAGYGTDLLFHDPLLNGLQLPNGFPVAGEGKPEYFTSGSVGWLDDGQDTVWQGSCANQVADLQARKCVIHLVLKGYFGHREPEKGRRSDADLLFRRVHGHFYRPGDEFFNFLGAPAGPLGNNGNSGIRHIRESIDGRIFKAEITTRYQQEG